MNLKPLHIIGITLLLFASCAPEDRWDCIKSSGEEVTVSRTLRMFHKLDVSDRIDVVISPSNEYRVEIKGGKNIIPDVETSLKDGTLFLRDNNTCNWVRDLSKFVEITVFVPELETIRMDGAGTITATDTLRGNFLGVDMWGSGGVVELPVVVNRSHSKIHTGPGDITFKGSSIYNFAYSTGNGFLDLDEFSTEITEAINWGTGDFSLTVTDSLYVEIGHLGSVTYYGQPEKVVEWLNGEGQAIAR